MADTDDINDPKAHAPLPTGKSSQITGINRSKPDQTAGSRSVKGRFLPGNKANPHGPPKGSLNQATLLAKSLLEESAPAVARSTIAAAIKGSPTAQKLVLERLLPRANDRRLDLAQLTQRTPHPNTDDNYTPEDILHAHNKLVEAVAGGDLSPTEAQAISQLLEARRRSWESLELSRRLNRLQDNADKLQLRK